MAIFPIADESYCNADKLLTILETPVPVEQAMARPSEQP